MSLKDDIKRPAFWIPLVVALVAFSFAIYAYIVPRKYKELSYLFSEPSLIYDSNNPSKKIALVEIRPLKIQKKAVETLLGENTGYLSAEGTGYLSAEGTGYLNDITYLKDIFEEDPFINDNVYLATISLWNSGTEPIEPEIVRKPLILKVINCNKILDYSIVREADKKISSFNLSPEIISDSENETQALKIDWKHFDPKHGIVFQVIYSAFDEHGLNFDHYIVNTSVKDSKPLAKKHPNVSNFVTFLIGIVFVNVFFIVLFPKIITIRSIKPFWRVAIIIISFAIFMFPLYLLIKLLMTGKSLPF